MADFAGGVTIPISDDNYKNFADPSFKLSLKMGAIFYVSRHFGVSAEGQFDWVPVNTDDNNFQNNGVNMQFNRIRFLGGSRFIVPFGIGSFYLRAALGVDYLTGSASISAFGVTASRSSSSTAFTFEPGFGVQFNVVRHLVVGVYTGFPIMTEHSLRFDVVNGVTLGPYTFTPVDVDVLAVLGIRF